MTAFLRNKYIYLSISKYLNMYVFHLFQAPDGDQMKLWVESINRRTGPVLL